MTDDGPWEEDGTLTLVLRRPPCECDVAYCAHVHGVLSTIANLLGARPGADIVLDQSSWPVPEYM